MVPCKLTHLIVVVWVAFNYFHHIHAFIPDRLYGAAAPTGKYHTTITEAGLREFARRYFNDNIPEGSDYIYTTSTSGMFQQYYQDARVSAKNFEATIDAIAESNANVDKNEDTKDNPYWHFDAEKFIEANEKVQQALYQIVVSIKNGNRDKMIDNMRILHTVQDFYSHSNWIEKGEVTPYSKMGDPDAFVDEISPPTQITCENCRRTTSEKVQSFFINAISFGGTLFKPIGGDPDRIYHCSGNLKEKKLLTSGYYSNQKDDDGNDVTKPFSGSKCSHGGILDATSEDHPTGGINKDSTSVTFSPHDKLHKYAAALATDATVEFMQKIRKYVNDDTLMGRAFQLHTGPSITFVIDRSYSMKIYWDALQSKMQQLATTYPNATLKPHTFLLIPFSANDIGPIYDYDNIEDLLDLFSYIKARRLDTKSDPSSPRMLFEALLLGAQESNVGGTIMSASDAFEFTEGGASLYDEIVDTTQRKRLTLDVVFDLDQIKYNHNNRLKRNVIKREINGGQSISHSLFENEGIHRIAHESGGTSYLVTPTTVHVALDSLDKHYDNPNQLILLRGYSNKDLNATIYVPDNVTSLNITISTPQLDGGGNLPIVLIVDNQNYHTTSGKLTALTKHLTTLTLDYPIEGQYTIQLLNSSTHFAFTVVCNGRMDVKVKLHEEFFDSNHPGTKELPEQPIVGSLLAVEVTVNNATEDEFEPEKVELQSADTNLIGSFKLIPMPERNNTYTTVIQIPKKGFYVAIIGSNKNVKMKVFKSTFIQPTTTKIKLRQTDNSPTIQSDAHVVQFQANVTNFGETGIFIFKIRDDSHTISDMSPIASIIPPNKSAIINFNVTVKSGKPNAKNTQADENDDAVNILSGGKKETNYNFNSTIATNSFYASALQFTARGGSGSRARSTIRRFYTFQLKQ